MPNAIGMCSVEQALDALAERGFWVCGQIRDPEMFRAQLRRAARRRGIRLRTLIDRSGRPVSMTPDGLPAEEPWRGAVVHLRSTDAGHYMIQAAWQRMRRETEQ